MEISRYASRLSSMSSVLPSGRPLQRPEPERDGSMESADGLAAGDSLPLRARGSLAQEPDDARLTGGTRSLSRRLLALNVPGISVAVPGISSAKKGELAAGSRGASVQKRRGRKAVAANPAMIANQA